MTSESPYLTVVQAAQYLNTSERFIRRLVAERRVAFHKVGAHLRFVAQDLDAFAHAGRVEPITARGVRRALARAS